MLSPTRRLNHSLPRVKNLLDICVVGAGGVGTIAAYVLENSQRARVTAVLRSNYALVKERGFDIDSIDHGKVTNWRPHNVVSGFASAAADKKSYDFIVITTKALPDLTSSIIAELKPLITPGKTSLALLQNGLAIEAPFAAAFPNTPIFSSVSMIGSRLTNSTSVFHQYPDVSKIGAHLHHVDDTFTGATQHAAAALYVDVYNAGLAAAKAKTNARCLLVEDIAGARWAKLLWNASFNTLCTVLRIPVGELLSGPGRNTLLEPAMREVAAVATAAGYGDAVSEDMIQNMLHDSAPTSTFRPSMLVDLENERPLELEVILGAPLKVAKEKGVSTPILTQVYELLNQIQWKLT
ncbi:Ketopantoate reductase [Cordyceps militaris]|uniref:2-dehydropantoate 2-reductase n=1 Tax=Cordyceps militaris TaxID=73501 RepID=A0A2H4SMA8_CORMI|nr:Ketopantoate reductase [Cordyceps militaris]